MRVRAATVNEVNPISGEWAYLDIGFSERSRSCALAIGDRAPRAYRFDEMVEAVARECRDTSSPLYLLIEAPLSAAFSELGTPTGRSIESRANGSRLWYCGPGASMLIATQQLLHALRKSRADRELRLVEGFASFKQRGSTYTHVGDVELLREIVKSGQGGSIVAPELLKKKTTDELRCPFQMMGIHFETPPVVLVDA